MITLVEGDTEPLAPFALDTETKPSWGLPEKWTL